MFGGLISAVAVVVVLAFAGHDRMVVMWSVDHFLWLQDQGIITIPWHNDFYRLGQGGTMAVAVVAGYGLLTGLVVWLLRRAYASEPRMPSVEVEGRHPQPPEGHGRYIGLERPKA